MNSRVHTSVRSGLNLYNWITCFLAVCSWNLAISQAFDDDNNTAYDYEVCYGEAGLNDVLPSGQRIFTLLTQPHYGEFNWLDNTTGSFSYYAPPLSYRYHSFQIDTLTYQVCVGNTCYEANIEIFLRFINDPPYTGNDTLYVETGSARWASVTANDGDPDTISDPVQGAYLSHGIIHPMYARTDVTPIDSFPQRNGRYLYQPIPGFIGQDFFTYYREEPWPCFGTSLPARVTIFVVPNNLDPVAQNGSINNALEEIESTINLLPLTSDPENDVLHFHLLSAPHGGIASLSDNGILRYTSTNNFIGSDTLQYTVMDLVGQLDTAFVFIQVANSNNDRPSLQNSVASAIEDQSTSFSIATPDVIDGDALTYAAVGSALHGSFSISAAGTIQYTPNANYSGSDVITYLACDAGNLCDTATVSVTVQGVNDAPSAVNDNNTTIINGALTSNLGVNDSDMDTPSGELSFVLQAAPQHGTVSITFNGSYTYTPDPFFYGNDSFEYRVCDPQGACDNGVVWIEVLYSNLAPTTTSVNSTTNEDENVIIHLQDVTFDFNGGDLVYTIIEANAAGTFTPMTNIGFEFTPTANYNGTFEVYFQVCDTGNACDTASLSIEVIPVNDSPIGIAQNLSTSEDNTMSWAAAYSDVDSDNLTISITSAPAYGSLDADGIYTPLPNYFGTDSFTYQVCDDSGACTLITESIVITPMNDAPIAFEETLNMQEDEILITNAITSNDFDVDGDPLLYSLLGSSGNASVELTSAGLLHLQPESNYNGYIYIGYVVCDSFGSCTNGMATIQILPVNDAPISAFPLINMDEDTAQEFNPGAYVSDIENDAITFSIVSAAGVNPFYNIATSTYDLQPIADYFGNGELVLHTCDAQGLCITDTIAININPINDAPTAASGEAFTFENIVLEGSLNALVDDIDNNQLTADVSAIQHGTMLFNDSLQFVYTPENGYVGLDTVSFSVCDAGALCANAQLIISVYAPNQAPSVAAAAASICQGESVAFNVHDLVSDDAELVNNLSYSFDADAAAEILWDDNAAEIHIAPSALTSGQLNVVMTVCDHAEPALCGTSTLTIEITPTYTPLFSGASINAVSCHGMNDGSIAIVQTEDSTSTLYTWDSGAVGHSITNLAAGNYSVTITSSLPCSVPNYAQFNINEPAALEITTASTNISDAGNGSISLDITGGVAPYNAQWTGPNGFTSASLDPTDLADAGDYSATITDANGCSATVTLTINGIAESAIMSAVVFPNPMIGDWLTISLSQQTALPCAYWLEDMAGRTILSGRLYSTKETLDVGTLSDGYYILHLQTQSESFNQKIARQSNR